MLSHGMVQCILEVSLYNSEIGRTFFVILGIGTFDKIIFFNYGIWTIAALSLTEKHSFIFLYITTTALVKIFSFLKQTSCFPHFLLGSHLTVLIHLIRTTTIMAISTQRILSSDLFSHEMVQCFLGVSLQSFENVGKFVFVNLGIGVRLKKNFLIVNAGQLQPETSQKNTVAHFPLHYNNRLGQVFELSESNRLLATSSGKSSNSTILPIQGNN